MKELKSLAAFEYLDNGQVFIFEGVKYIKWEDKPIPIIDDVADENIN